eukprot:1264593-Rhodomonas_salina.4
MHAVAVLDPRVSGHSVACIFKFILGIAGADLAVGPTREYHFRLLAANTYAPSKSSNLLALTPTGYSPRSLPSPP